MQFQKRSGPLLVTLFSAPVPLRTGIADLSVMVQKASDRSDVLNAEVTMQLTKAGEPRINISATRAQSTNKLLYAVRVVLPSAGTWHVRVNVQSRDGNAEVSGDVGVQPREGPLTDYWPYFALVPIGVGLFGLNQWLKARQRSGRARRDHEARS